MTAFRWASTRPPHGLDRLFMGTPVERLVGEAPCDVLTAPAVTTVAQPATPERKLAVEMHPFAVRPLQLTQRSCPFPSRSIIGI